MGALSRLHVHHVVPFMGALLSGHREYRYLQESIQGFPAPDAFAELMRQAGLKDVQTTRLTFGTATLFVAKAP